MMNKIGCTIDLGERSFRLLVLTQRPALLGASGSYCRKRASRKTDQPIVCMSGCRGNDLKTVFRDLPETNRLIGEIEPPQEIKVPASGMSSRKFSSNIDRSMSGCSDYKTAQQKVNEVNTTDQEILGVIVDQ
ncbi:hypothetical protein RRG08_027992 [Elysia crispata]|uniref:Uncharacterized protein n=1 Tax=Elysia crispata TaxID=231223 RepID=A0AAE1EDT9_9GAST|nr:hypothetical protein RRG08_027992 [Elysia crispata]